MLVMAHYPGLSSSSRLVDQLPSSPLLAAFSIHLQVGAHLLLRPEVLVNEPNCALVRQRGTEGGGRRGLCGRIRRGFDYCRKLDSLQVGSSHSCYLVSSFPNTALFPARCMVLFYLIIQVLAQHIGLGEAHQTAAIKAATVLRYGSGSNGFSV